MRRLRKLAKLLSFGLVVGYLIGCTSVAMSQRSLFYPADPARTDPASVGLSEFTEVLITTSDDETLVTWQHPVPAGRPTVIYFHGNGGTLRNRVHQYRTIAQAGFGVVALSYRGYGGSTGSPFEAGLKIDALAAYDAAAEQGAPLIVFGESLGTGLAVYVASQRPVAAVILQSPYTALWRVAAWRAPWLPVNLLATERMATEDIIGEIDAPLLIQHGRLDKSIPVEMSIQLVERAPEPKQAVYFDKAGHNNLWRYGAWAGIERFLGGLFPG
jgi:fermentation-respiration switch protein FrsA (DUF1100 family)